MLCIGSIVLRVDDLRRQTEFWQAALGYVRRDDGKSDDFVLLGPPDGVINGQWRYLFCESLEPNIWQRQRGYLVPTGSSETFFREDLALSVTPQSLLRLRYVMVPTIVPAAPL